MNCDFFAYQLRGEIKIKTTPLREKCILMIILYCHIFNFLICQVVCQLNDFCSFSEAAYISDLKERQSGNNTI